jgi:hypothetical protein
VAGVPVACAHTITFVLVLRVLQLRPLLSELAALRRADQGRQKQLDQLQLQLANAERDAQAAMAAAAADRAHARRTITQAHQRLAAALQRLKALAERQQQQSLLLQEVRRNGYTHPARCACQLYLLLTPPPWHPLYAGDGVVTYPPPPAPFTIGTLCMLVLLWLPIPTPLSPCAGNAIYAHCCA